MIKKFIMLLCIVNLISGISVFSHDAQAADINSPAPHFELQDLSGNKVSLTDFEGKIIILDFWATWCPPCIKEIPGFIRLQTKYGAQGVAVIGVSVDQAGASAVGPFAEKYGINYTMLLADDNIVDDYGPINGIPTTFIIDQEGSIVKRYVGYHDEAVFEGDIQNLLK